MMQAMWAATPIASLTFDPDGIIRKHRLGVPPAQKLEEFAESINRLLEDERELIECGKRAFQYAKENHDIEKNANMLIEAIKKII